MAALQLFVSKARGQDSSACGLAADDPCETIDTAFELHVRLPSSDLKKKWAVVDGPFKLQAASFEDLCSELHGVLLSQGRVDSKSTSVTIDTVFDGDEDWLSVDSLDEIPSVAKVTSQKKRQENSERVKKRCA